MDHDIQLTQEQKKDDNIRHDIRACFLVSLTCIGKLVASSVVLNETSSCFDIKSIWIILMIVHDAVEYLLNFVMINVWYKLRTGTSIDAKEIKRRDKFFNISSNLNLL